MTWIVVAQAGQIDMAHDSAKDDDGTSDDDRDVGATPLGSMRFFLGAGWLTTGFRRCTPPPWLSLGRERSDRPRAGVGPAARGLPVPSRAHLLFRCFLLPGGLGVGSKSQASTPVLYRVNVTLALPRGLGTPRRLICKV